MSLIALIIIGWMMVAIALGFAAFKLTSPPLAVKSASSLFRSVAARSLFWAYLFAPYIAFIIIAPASLLIPVYLTGSDPGQDQHIRECFYSLAITWAVFTGIYITRQILKKKWP